MEPISRISSLLETARDLTIEAAQSASAARGFSSRAATRNVPFIQLKKLLDSRNDREILEGLRKVISMMYRSQQCLPFFSFVVKNVASPNIEIKKLVYIYILHYAESEPDLALLSINTIQKSLTDQNPQVRAMALRVMSGIRVPVISQIVSLGIKRGCGDMSPYVRKAAALAIPKCYRLDPKTLPQLIEYLSILLGDKQYYVVGSAVTAFLEVCPDRIDLIHKHYRGIIRKLVDMDEWGQLATLRLMVIYARKCFPRRTQRTKKTGSKGFYGDEGSDEEDLGEEIQVLDPDLDLLLKACKPLLQSRNSAVIVAVVRCFLYLGTPEYIDSAIGPLVALLRSPQDIQHIALYNIISVCLVRPGSFVKYATHFLVRTLDPPHIWRLKLEILTIIFPQCDPHTKGVILSELEHFTRVSDRELVRESVRAIGRCAQSDNRTSARCLRLLLKQISSPDGNLVAESLTVIRHLIQQDPLSHTKTVIQLAKNLDTTADPEARANIIWLVGEFAGIDSENNIAPDVLRILAKGFANESEAAKLQIVLLAAKVYVHYLNRIQSSQAATKAPSPSSQNYTAPSSTIEGHGFSESPFNPTTDSNTRNEPAAPEKEHPIAILWNYILLLVRYDTSYDLRDRARLYKALLADPSSTQLASLLLLAPKPVPHTPSPSESHKGFMLGTASLVIGQEGGVTGLNGYEPLPDWVKDGEEPDPGLRDEGGAKAEYGEKRSVPAGEKLDSVLKQQGVVNGKVNGMGVGAKEKTLDDWLAESEEDDEEDESEESSEEESSEEESEEEESEVEGEHGKLVK
ncbi:MAG: AP-3 complex subunit beta [Pleopsidium flavum]|nr:MAG: AP-3 complex subunit beta [Pleopsidium flavum]